MVIPHLITVISEGVVFLDQWSPAYGLALMLEYKPIQNQGADNQASHQKFDPVYAQPDVKIAKFLSWGLTPRCQTPIVKVPLAWMCVCVQSSVLTFIFLAPFIYLRVHERLVLFGFVCGCVVWVSAFQPFVDQAIGLLPTTTTTATTTTTVLGF